MQKYFFSQHILDSLIEEGKITLDGAVLTLLREDRPTYQLEPGYRIRGTSGNAPDPHKLCGRIMYASELEALHAEIYLNSLVYRDTAYEVETGYIGERKELADKLSDADLLAKGLLDGLF